MKLNKHRFLYFCLFVLNMNRISIYLQSKHSYFKHQEEIIFFITLQKLIEENASVKIKTIYLSVFRTNLEPHFIPKNNFGVECFQKIPIDVVIF